MTRAKDQARIEFLAQARNRALEPLWLNNSMATSTSLLLPHDTEVYCSDPCTSGLKHAADGKHRAEPNTQTSPVVLQCNRYMRWLAACEEA